MEVWVLVWRLNGKTDCIVCATEGCAAQMKRDLLNGALDAEIGGAGEDAEDIYIHRRWTVASRTGRP